MSPVELSPASETAPSSSTLWAQRTHIFSSYRGRAIHPSTTTASKEWVIPAKPKPGRKPKEATIGATVPKDDVVRLPVSNARSQADFRCRSRNHLPVDVCRIGKIPHIPYTQLELTWLVQSRPARFSRTQANTTRRASSPFAFLRTGRNRA